MIQNKYTVGSLVRIKYNGTQGIIESISTSLLIKHLNHNELVHRIRCYILIVDKDLNPVDIAKESEEETILARTGHKEEDIEFIKDCTEAEIMQLHQYITLR